MEEKAKPIYSAREDEEEIREELNDFVIALAEDVDLLQDAESAGNLTRLASLADSLHSRAEGLGYAPLARIAAAVREAAREDKPEVAQNALIELTDVARRIRLGHRGAA